MSSMDDVDIFEPEPRRVRGSRATSPLPSLTPAQLANLAASFAPKSATIDIFGEFPEFPRGNMTVEQMMSGPRAPSLRENLREGDYLSALLQGLGGVGDVASVIPVAGPLIGGVLKAPRAAQRLLRAKEAGFDFDNVMYHASKQDIDEFVPGYDDGLVFLTPNKEFANNWLGKGKFKERQGGTGAIEGVRKEIEQLNEEAEEILRSLPEDQRSQYYEEVLRPKRQQLYQEEREADSAIYPVVTRAKKPFVPHKDYEVLEELFGKERMDSPFSQDLPQLRDGYKSGNYLLYENPEVVRFLKTKGYDSMFLKESTATKADIESPEYSTFAVFEPSDIRSIYAEFEDLDSPDLLKAEGGQIRKFARGGGIADLIIKGDFDPRFDPRKREQEMLRNLEAEIIGSNYTRPMPRLALSELEGEDFVTSMTDRTRAGGDVKSINRVELVDPIYLPGGQDFMFNNPSAVWSSAEKPSREILQLARDLKSKSGKDPLYIPWRMAPTGGDFSTTTGELMLGYAAANMTKTTKKALDKAIRSYETTGKMVKGKRVGAGRKIEGWKGIDDPSSVEVWRNTPDSVRKELMNMMDVEFRNKGGLSIGAARLINADPTQLTARDAGIQNVGRIFADIDIFESDHPSYPYAVPGTGLGVLRKAGAATAFDLLPEARFGKAQKKVKDPASPTKKEIRALQMKPYGGTITEDILRRMEARGVDVNSITGMTGGALTFTLLSAGLVTPQEVEAGALKQFAEQMLKADRMDMDTDQILYHGSTFNITEFAPSLYADNDFGKGTYFTVSPSDASRNYAGEGPDLANRMSELAEKIEESLKGDSMLKAQLNPEFWDKIGDPKVVAKIKGLVDKFYKKRDLNALTTAVELAATTILKGPNDGVIYPVFVNNKDFAVIGGKNKTVIKIDRDQYYESAREEINRSDFESDNDYEDAVFEYANELENTDYESQTAELAYSLRKAGAREEAVDDVIESVMEDGQIDFTTINDIVRGYLNPDFETGEYLSNGQIMQDVLVDLGYKGVVDNTAGEKFAGMGAGKMHTIVFPGNENLIRSINAKFDPAQKDSANILASAPPVLIPAGVGVGAATMTPETQAKVKEMKKNLAGVEAGLDALSAMYSPAVGGAAGFGSYTTDLPRRLAAKLYGADRDTLDMMDELSAARARAVKQKVTEALDYEPSTPEGREMSRKAQEGIAQLTRPIVEAVQPQLPMARAFLRTLPGYEAGKYLYEDIFGESEREAIKSAMDVAL